MSIGPFGGWELNQSLVSPFLLLFGKQANHEDDKEERGENPSCKHGDDHDARFVASDANVVASHSEVNRPRNQANHDGHGNDDS